MEEEQQIISENLQPEKPSIISRFKDAQNKKTLLAVGLIGFIILLTVAVWIFTTRNNSNITHEEASFNNEFLSSNFVEAEKLAKKGLEKDPNNKKLLAGVITALASQGNQTGTEAQTFEKAQPYVVRALEVAPNDVDILLAVGYLYETAGRYEEALKYYDQAINIDQKNSIAYFRKGNTLAFLNRMEEAQEMFERAAALDPDNVLVLQNKGNMLVDEGKYEEAYRAFIKGDSPQNDSYSRAVSLSLAAQSKQLQGDLKTALSLSEKAVNTDNNCAPCLTTHALNTILAAGSNANEVKKGTDMIQNSSSMNPRISYNYLLAGSILRQLGKIEDSFSMIQLALSMIDDDNTLVGEDQKKLWRGIMLYELAETYSRMNDSKNSITSLSQALALNPRLKTNLLSDMEKKNYFSEVKNNPNFPK